MLSTKLLKPYFKKNFLIIGTGLFCLIVVDLLQLIIPRIIKWVIDDIATFQADTKKLLIYAFYIIGCAILTGIFRYIWRRSLIGMSRKIEEGLRNTLFEHIQKLSASYFDKTKTGVLMAHATNDIMNIRMATGMGIVALTDALILGGAAIGFMAYINIPLTILVILPFPLLVFCSRFFTKKMHQLYMEVQEIFSDLSESVREKFSGIRIIKAYNMEKEAALQFNSISKDYVAKNISLIKIIGSFFPMLMLFSNLSLVIVLYVGGKKTIGFQMTPGDFVAFISYLALMSWPVMAAGWLINLLQRGRASLNRIDKILQTRPEITDLPDSIHVSNITGDIVFKNVTFSYNHNRLAELSDINIKLEHGKITGIVGPPGSGKTTLLNLIPRLYDITDGQILINDFNIKNISICDLRSEISFVSQEPFLFAGTIRDNILFGQKNIDEPALIKACKEASLYDNLMTLPNGFDTIVGEKGVILSGGQRQRVAIARAFLHDAPVLILDDPVSQVDVETANIIISTIRKKTAEKTIIIASHRLAAISFSDKIISLENGRIIESGSHSVLMKNNSYYATVYRLQEIEIINAI